MKNRITFLGIGAQKSGTSWLFHNLNQIPEISMPPIKELHYFDRSPDYPSPNWLFEPLLVNRIKQKKYFLNGLRKVFANVVRQNWKLSRFYLKWYFLNYSDKWYLSLFKDFEGYTGEITPSYSILNEEDIRRIHDLQPDVKLILMLRNPIERAWSHYRFNSRQIENFNFDKINTDNVIKFMESKRQSLRSDYIRTISNYSNVFPKEQILICFYDAISEKPKALIDNILKHIHKDIHISTSQLNLKKAVNISPKIDCPKEIDDYLKSRYHNQIKELSQKYGGYFTKWYQESYLDNSLDENTRLLPTMYIKS